MTRLTSLVTSVVLMCVVGGCDGAVDGASASGGQSDMASPAVEVTSPVPEYASLDAALLGTWSPYDDASNEQLGEALIGDAVAAAHEGR